MVRKDVLLMGIPRSGTTLCCSLLNRLPNTLALVEPMDVGVLWQCRDSGARQDAITDFFREQRTSIIETKTALARVTCGLYDDNTFRDSPNEYGLRQASLSLSKLRVEKSLDVEFTLVIKHPNALTAILAEIVDRFSCFAVIRNPVSVLASWNTLSIPLRDGHAPAAENLDGILKAALKQSNNRFERQVRLIDWYFEKYAALLPPERIIRYERIVETGGSALEVIDPSASGLDERLSSRNSSEIYDPGIVAEVSRALRAYGSAWKAFYPNL